MPKPTPPLFEMMARQDADVEATPAERPEPVAAAPPEDGNGLVRLPMTWIYIACTVVLALVIASWTLGYRQGSADGEERVISQYGLDRPPIGEDPLVSDPGSSREEARKETSTPPPPKPGVVDRGEGSGVLVAGGELREDPRVGGYNYLVLVTGLTPEQATGGLEFVGSRGIDLIAVPLVDSRTGRVKNPVRYELVSRMGLAPGEFQSRQRDRETHERDLARIGREWLAGGGASDFSDPLWRKYRGDP